MKLFDEENSDEGKWLDCQVLRKIENPATIV